MQISVERDLNTEVLACKYLFTFICIYLYKNAMHKNIKEIECKEQWRIWETLHDMY